MNLYLRLLALIFWKIPRHKASQDLLATGHFNFRVLPLDVDINRHLTNSRYLALMDLARLWLMSEAGVFGKLIKQKWLPVVSSIEITFIKDIKPWQCCTIESKIVAWDNKYFYIEQRFVSQDRVYAIANLKGLFVHKRKPIDTEKLLALAGIENTESPPIPEDIKHWQMMLAAKKAKASHQ